MTRHLSDDALLDILEGKSSRAGGDETGGDHLTHCAKCRERVDKARDAWLLAREVEVPEPSPLFWDHLSARVRERVADEQDAGSAPATWWARLPRWRPVGAGALLLIVGAVVAVWLAIPARQPAPTLSARHDAVSSPRVTAPEPVAESQEVDLLEPASNASWMLIGAVTQQTDPHESLLVQPGTVDRAVARLSADEQREFVRLLQTDIEEPEPPSQ